MKDMKELYIFVMENGGGELGIIGVKINPLDDKHELIADNKQFATQMIPIAEMIKETNRKPYKILHFVLDKEMDPKSFFN